jgi:hypothetical protein
MRYAVRGGVGTDPLQINDLSSTANGGGAILLGNTDTTGKTASSTGTALTGGEKTLIHLVIGDSIASNSCPAYTVTNPTKNDNLNYYVNPATMWQYKDPYLCPSTGPGSWPGIAADDLISDGTKFSRVISIGCAMGGATSYDWSKSGPQSHKIIAALIYCRRYGYPLSGTVGVASMAVSLALGTNDGILGYSGTGYTNYTQSTIQLLRDYGFKGKIFIPIMTKNASGVVTALQTAQAALVNTAAVTYGSDGTWSGGVYAGPNVESITRGGDNIHPDAAGAIDLAGRWKTTFLANY